jgi:hypothetical protein
MLAGVYRQTGNLVEAGRWSFLADRMRPEELAAFERAHPSPWLRLRQLRYGGDPRALTPAARARLRALAEEAERAGPPAIWQGPPRVPLPEPRGVTLPCLFVLLVLAVFAALTGIGVYRAVLWVVNY